MNPVTLRPAFSTASLPWRTLMVWCSLLLPGISLCQPIVTGADRALDAPVRTDVIQTLLKQLTIQYVFPKVAAQIQQAIQTRMSAGAYDPIVSSKALADTVTALMQRISRDKHLRLFYQDKPSPSSVVEPNEQVALHQYARQINFGIEKIDVLAGQIGYLRIDEFVPVDLAAEPITAAMTQLNDTDALILDLRYNRGGEPATVAFLASYFFGPAPVHLNDIVRREGMAVQSFWTQPKLAGRRYLGKPLYILTSRRTFSAGEEFAYDLQSLNRATLVGEPTAGGAHAGEYVRISDHFTAFIPVEYAVNPTTHTNWEGTGVRPDLPAVASKALKTAHVAAMEILIQAAPAVKKRALDTVLEQIKTTGEAGQ